MNIESIARVAHEVHRAYCEALGDHSQVPWEEAPEWQKSSVINGVKMHARDGNVMPEESHAAWMREKTAKDHTSVVSWLPWRRAPTSGRTD